MVEIQVDEDGIRPHVWANVGRCFLMAAMLNMHIELYGESQAYMGDMVSIYQYRFPPIVFGSFLTAASGSPLSVMQGPVIAWPLIMSL